MPLFGESRPKVSSTTRAFYAELILEISRIDEAYIGNPVRDEIDLGRRRLVYLLQHLSSALGHDHQPGGERDQPFHHAPLVGSRLAQNGMKGGDDGHSQFAQKRQDVTADRPAENAELVLQADDVHVADIQKVRGTQIGRQVLLLNLEANHLRVLVASRNVVDRYGEALALGVRTLDGGQQVGGESGNAALARQVVADKSDLADFRSAVHEGIPLLPGGLPPLRSVRFSGLPRRREMQRVPQVLQLTVVINRGRPLSLQLQSFQKRDFFIGGIAAQGRILQELFEPRFEGGGFCGAPVRQTRIASGSLP